MSSVVLSIAGGAIAGPWGAAIGAALGSYIDNTFLFPPPDSEGPRIDGMRFGQGSEGMAYSYVWGEARVSAKMVWAGPNPIREERTRHGGGGCGGPTQTTYTYYAHGLYDVAQMMPEGWCRKVLGNGRELYSADNDVTIASADIDVTELPIFFDEGVWYYAPTSTGIDLRKFVTGQDITISGCTNPGNNGTFLCIGKGSSTIGGVECTYVAVFHTSGHTTETGGNTVITISQDPANVSKYLANVEIFNGGLTQNASPLVESIEGVGRVPARRGRAGICLVDVTINEFGNTMPNVEVVVRERETLTVAALIDEILSMTRLIKDVHWNTAALAGINIKGFVWNGRQRPVDMLKAVMMAYGIGAQEVAGQLRFFNRNAPDTIVITKDQLSARQFGTEPGPDRVKSRDVNSDALPKRVTIHFLDSENDFQPGATKDVAEDQLAQGEQTRSIRFPIVMTPAQGRVIGQRLLRQFYAGRERSELSLPPSMVHVAEGDLLRVQTPAREQKIRAERVDYGRNRVLSIEGASEVPSLHDLSIEYDTEPHPTDREIGSGQAIVITAIADVAPMLDAHATQAGFYVGGFLMDTVLGWPISQLEEQKDGASSWLPARTIYTEADVGYVETIPALTSSPHYWDTKSTLVVKMYSGELVGRPEADIFSGLNWALVGSEVIGFCTATPVGANTYQLTRLLRGLRGTESSIGTHAVNEQFIMLDSLYFYDLVGVSEFGKTNKYRTVPLDGGDPNDAPQRQHTIACGALTPFPVWAVEAVRDASNNLAVTFQPQSRGRHGIWSPNPGPLFEPFERYEIDVISGGNPTANSPYTVDGPNPVFNYSAAQHTADGLTPGNPITLKIYQMSAQIGRGRVKEVTV